MVHCTLRNLIKPKFTQGNSFTLKFLLDKLCWILVGRIKTNLLSIWIEDYTGARATKPHAILELGLGTCISKPFHLLSLNICKRNKLMLVCDLPILRLFLKNGNMWDWIGLNSTEMLCHFLNCQHLDVWNCHWEKKSFFLWLHRKSDSDRGENWIDPVLYIQGLPEIPLNCLGI